VDPRRREVLRLLGFAVLAVQVVPLGGCGSPAQTPPADSLAVTSSLGSRLGHWADHSHVLYVPLDLLRAPPREGVTLYTTRTYFHSHEVTLTHDQLTAVARGATVQVSDSVEAHHYSIRLET